MAIREVRIDEDPVLRKKSKKIDEVTEKIQILIDDMIETMHVEDGVGLAAVQVGILKRVIVYDLYDDNGAKALINPEIISESGEQIEAEGCLSLPEKTANVKRPLNVLVRGVTREGRTIEINAKGLLARVFCHEIDHLNGILFIDRVQEEK